MAGVAAGAVAVVAAAQRQRQRRLLDSIAPRVVRSSSYSSPDRMHLPTVRKCWRLTSNSLIRQRQLGQSKFQIPERQKATPEGGLMADADSTRVE